MTDDKVEKPTVANETVAPFNCADTTNNVFRKPRQMTYIRPVKTYLTDDEYDEMFNNVPV
ncbi:hypothetical protein [Sulfitobacter guttiformis]|uniref:Uncharacterized protein n=1 Tax=Sulfitobacter guttiformis TaxID=74349 RepID=A0A420DJ72_9RHOB|nr:hypothetical protein [Sulfitobacter guttiformis]KIN71927.1 hypothetical protein Z949_1093 [Sulfitobacter guttiformis KCTC 32187]RKE94267.1 hypothetical protein C8N30_3388 [Sulfitobacter guttiformis]